MIDNPTAYKQMFLAGEWLIGDGKPLTVKNPWNNDTLMSIKSATKADVDKAYQAAEAAQKEWGELSPTKRSQILAKIAKDAENHIEVLVDWLHKEGGATKVKAYLEATATIAIAKQAVTLPFEVEGKVLPSDTAGKASYSIRKPLGVIALISPWNFPMHLTARTLLPALAVGNAVVIKPDSDTPVSGGLIFAKMCENAGVPKGLVSVLPGNGSDIGAAVAEHRTARLVSFTGSTAVGRMVGKSAMSAEIIKNIELELGGNGPMVILADADIDQAVEAAVFGKFLHSGQICMAINRIIVHDDIFDTFADKFVKRVKQLKCKNADADDTFIGPIINQSQLDSILELIQAAKDKGCEPVLEGNPDGLHLPPHVFVDVPEDSPLIRNEIFGPVAALIRAKNNDEALRLANDTDYGLSAAVFTNDLQMGREFALQIQAGMVHVNDQTVNDSPYAPFGGMKNSGIGRFNGQWAVDAFTQTQWLSVQESPRQFPFSAERFRTN